MLELRPGGIILFNGDEVGRLELHKSYLEPELVGFWFREGSEELDELIWGGVDE